MLAPELVTLDVTLTCSPDPHSAFPTHVRSPNINATKDFIKSKKLKDYTKIALKELRGCETSPRKVSSISLDSSSDEDNDNIFVTPKGRKGLASTKMNSSSSEESENELSLEVARVISTTKKTKM